MGKGGRSAENNSSYKLDHMATEELRKWAKAYYVAPGKSDSMDRPELLKLLNPFADGILDPLRPKNPPLDPPKFSLTDLHNAIPAHCFKRYMFVSFYHLFVDFALIALWFKLATYIPKGPLGYILWPVYWVLQGVAFTGVWVMAHECGHQAFSDSELVNNTVGTILHSLLLVPYHSWRISHAKHHSNTGSCENDEVFNPAIRSDYDHIKESPLAVAYGLVVMLVVGWMPGYLFFNATGPIKYRNKVNDHFSPNSALFDKDDYWLIVQSDIAWVMALGLVIYGGYTYGFLNLVKFYLIPYMIVNLDLVLITYLQHTDVFIPHLRSKEWNFLRGALCTVDRRFGTYFDWSFHHIADTHVLHHLFSKIPFYHAAEATEAIKKVLGEYYLSDPTPIPHALWRSFKCCQFVEDDGQYIYYKNMK